MKNILSFLSGKKVYLVSIFFAIFNCLLVFGVFTITPDQLVAVDGLFIALFGASFRSALTKSEINK